jgi:MFS family permease
MAVAVLGAAGVAFVGSVWMTAIQRLIPEEVLSRVSSYDWLVSFTVAPLGYAAVGPLADRAGRTAMLVLAIGCICASVIAVLAVPRIRALRQDPDGALHGWPELDVAVQPMPGAVVRHRFRQGRHRHSWPGVHRRTPTRVPAAGAP